MQRVLVAEHTALGYSQARYPAIARTSGRALLMVWEALVNTSSVHCANPASLLLSRSLDNGKTWEKPVVFAAGNTSDGRGFSGPSFLLDRVTGRLFCFYNCIYKEHDEMGASPQAAFFVAWSDDDGKTWKHRDITSMIIAGRNLQMAYIPRGRGTQLSSGLFAQRLCHAGVVMDPSEKRRAVFIGSDDQGITWWSSHPVGSDVEYCSVVQNGDATEVVLMMKTLDGVNLWAKSGDGGRHFSGPVRDIEPALVNALSPLEQVFHGAKPGSPHADVVTYVGQRCKCFSDCTVLMLSVDAAATFEPAVRFDAESYGSVDVVSMPDCAQFAIACTGEGGIMCELLDFSMLPIANLAKEWVENS